MRLKTALSGAARRQAARSEEGLCAAAQALGGRAQPWLGWAGLARFWRLSRDLELMPEALAGLDFVVFAILMLPKAVGADLNLTNSANLKVTRSNTPIRHRQPKKLM